MLPASAVIEEHLRFVLNQIKASITVCSDWARGAAGVRYSYTVELPDTGKQRFLLPASRIRPTAREAARAVTAMAGDIAARLDQVQ